LDRQKNLVGFDRRQSFGVTSKYVNRNLLFPMIDRKLRMEFLRTPFGQNTAVRAGPVVMIRCLTTSLLDWLGSILRRRTLIPATSQYQKTQQRRRCTDKLKFSHGSILS